MDWVGRITGDKTPTGAADKHITAEMRGAEVGGLDFKSAVDAHMKWKGRLEAYINGTSDEDLRVDVISCDDKCPLGKWIYSRGGDDFGYSETFFDMKAHHAHFHRCAGDVVRTAQAGDKDEALKLLHHGDYVRASEKVKKLLAKLFVLVVDGKTAIDAHMKWKERLQDFVAGRSTESLDEFSVAREDLCSLGKWINNEGAETFRDNPNFHNLRSAHRKFHEAAGHIVSLASTGQADVAMQLLEDGDYAQASDDVTAALVDMFAKRD
ncbi:MAG: CZB domain-containing protein [Gammaproteobacteria bacterium]|nr:CZB domain-containing protein [Gammaproteobacteria bacterium]MBU1414361.1 CZB domain-containing protein [Gammaproteobacteria bacterium]